MEHAATTELPRLARDAGWFVLTAIAEIVGCYLPRLVLRQERPWWLWLSAFVSLGLFAWPLTPHPSAAGRTYAACGGVYIPVALGCLALVERLPLIYWDLLGATSHVTCLPSKDDEGVWAGQAVLST